MENRAGLSLRRIMRNEPRPVLPSHLPDLCTERESNSDLSLSESRSAIDRAVEGEGGRRPLIFDGLCGLCYAHPRCRLELGDFLNKLAPKYDRPRAARDSESRKANELLLNRNRIYVDYRHGCSRKCLRYPMLVSVVCARFLLMQTMYIHPR
jgi:hypothetical protein